MIEPKPQPELSEFEIDLSKVEKSNWKTPTSRELYDNVLKRTREVFPIAKARTIANGNTRKHGGIVWDPNGDVLAEVISNDALCAEKVSHTGIPKFHPMCGQRGDWYAIADNEKHLGALIESFTGCSSAVLDATNAPSCSYNMVRDVKQTKAPHYRSACNSDTAERIDSDPETVRVVDGHPSINPIWNRLGVRLIDFPPCSFDCDAAQEIAIENGKHLRNIAGDDIADRLFEFLYQPATWSAYNGLVHIRNRDMIASYDGDDYWNKREVVWKGDHEPKR